jgi:SAM-dependent methyltransferase
MQLPVAARKLRAAPWIAYYKLRGKPARDYEGQWQTYWSKARSGEGGNDVLWDSEDEVELTAALDRFEPYLDRSLPMLDFGCGNGRRARFLADRFNQVIGIDVSPAAIDLARRQSSGLTNVEFRVLDGLDGDAVGRLADEFGPVNIYMRTVFHVIHEKDRPKFLSNLGRLLGGQGHIYQLETDGQALDYFLSHPEDSPSGLPKLMHKVIQSGIVPHGFGEADCQRWYGGPDWEILQSGPDVIHTLDVGGVPGRVPAYAVIAKRAT